jgi:hypothetical protein
LIGYHVAGVIIIAMNVHVDCDTDHCLVAAGARERLLIGKWAVHKFGVENFDLKKINQQQYLVVIFSSFSALEHSDANVDISRAQEHN